MYKNILVPVLLDKGHSPAASFEAAQALADKNAQFTVLHVMEALPTYATSNIPEETLASARHDVEGALRDLARGLPNATWTVVSGHSGRTIVEYAGEHGNDCIVLASHKPGFENYFLGSTADRVVRHAKCAVHVIR